MPMQSSSEFHNLDGTHSTSVDSGNIPIRQSRHLPHWLWVAITKSLGIKRHDHEKPILSAILYMLTYSTCFGLSFTTLWFTVYDIISDYTKTTIIDGMVNIFYTILWGALGVYAQKLAFRLYSHPHFVKFIKLHSKTILKMNAAVILFLLMTLFVIINNIIGFRSFESSVCQRVGLEIIICKLRYIFRVLFSVFALLWNYLVAFALTSICRSHVIKIRKFMKILEQDSLTYETKFLGLSPSTTSAPLEEYSWLDENYLNELEDNEESELYHSRKLIPRTAGGASGISNVEHSASSHPSSDEDTGTEFPSKKTVEPLLSNDEILFNYWKIQTDLRISCVALQRWMVSVISLVAIWLTMNLVLWLNYDPNLIDMVNFFLPLLLLPLLSSAYAEVNQEGQRVLKFICLTENRLQVFLVLQTCPLEMGVYNYSLSYKTIGTAAFGVLLALASKILLQKLFK